MKRYVENIKMDKFETPGIKEWDFMTVLIKKKTKKILQHHFP